MTLPVLQSPALRDYLDPSLTAQLASQGDLAWADRARLAATLRDALIACAAYIPTRLVRAQLADPQPGRVGGAFWHGSLLFADLSGFTALSEKLRVLGKQGAEEVSAIINQLFDALVAEVYAYQGTLLKFGGDALTAFFDAETLGDSHAGAATSAGLAMQRRMDAFAALQTRVGTFHLALRVGVHSGRVFAAEVGDTSHIELVVTGPEVNRVALAQEIATPGEVVISDETAALLEGARLEERADGFQHVRSLLYFRLPPAPPALISRDGPDDVATLDLLARQVAALRPYLVRGLPQRFLDPTADALGEFRPVSVLFANFHDFSALLTHLGEDVATAATVLNAYYQRAQAVVHRYGGTVNKVDMSTHGDKLMALFGAPIAHEDDPLRAVRCALELEGALVAANEEIAGLLSDDKVASWQGGMVISEVHVTLSPHHPVTLSQKIGLNTGTVFAGRVGGEGRYEYTVMGPAVNLAARLMAAAGDGSVLLSPATSTAVGRQVELVEQVPLKLKGLDEPVVPARAVRILADERKGNLAETNLSRPPLVGRDTELALLTDVAQVALSGSGRVLTLVGDAGIGKTRLIEAALQQLVLRSGGHAGDVSPFSPYLVDAQSYDQNTPYAVIRELLRQFFRLDLLATDTHTLLAARVMALVPELARFTPLLGDLLGMSLEETPLTAALPPEQRHDRAQELVVALFVAEARIQPLMLIVDDIHWADASSLQLLTLLARQITQVPVLLLLGYRPDAGLVEPWRELEHHVSLRLGELSSDGSAALLHALLGAAPPPRLNELIEKAQGNPFFVEEVVRSLVESGALQREDKGWQLTGELDERAIPDSIEGVITARLDRLEDRSREILQVASVIGRRFPYVLLADVIRRRDSIIEQLDRLTEGDLIISEETERELAYLFRHALTRDVAYEAILYARRRDLHRRVALEIERQQHDHLDEYEALLSRHYLLAEEWLPAFRYHLAAGIHAQQRYANQEALTLFHGALAIVPYLEQAGGNTPAVQVAELHERCGDVHVLLGAYDLAHASYMQALTLADTHQEVSSERRVRLHRLMAAVEERRSNYDAAFEWLERGMAQAKSDARAEVARCYLLGAAIYHRQGELARSMEWANLSLSTAKRLGDTVDQSRALLLLGILWHDQGQFSEAIPLLEQARELLETINNIVGLSGALNDLGMVYHQVGRWQDTVACYEQSLAISENVGDIQAMARTSNNLAVVLVARGELQRAGELYRFSSEQFGAIGSVLGVALTTYNRGEVLLLQGQPEAALTLFQESIATFERIKARNFLPEVLRLSAEAVLMLGNIEQAQAYAQQSLAHATDLSMAVDEAIAQRVLGQIALATGDLVAAESYLTQSHLALEHLDNRYELGKAHYWQARLARATGQITQMSSAVQQAEVIFTQLDAQRDLAMVRALAAEMSL